MLPAVPAPPRGRWTLIGLLAAATFINYLDRGSLAVALPVLSRDLHLDPVQQGLTLSAFFWTYAAMQIPMGRLVDRYNIRIVYAASFGLWSLAATATGFATGLWTLVLCRVLLGVGESVYLPGGMKVVSLGFRDEESAFPASVFDLGAKVGLAIGTAVDVWLLVAFGWRSLFFRTGLVGLLWLVPWLWLFPRQLHGSESRARIDWKGLAVDRSLIGISLGFFCFDFFWYFLISWLPTYLHDVRHVTLPRIAIVGALPFVIFAAAEGLGGWSAGVMLRRGWNLSMVTKGSIAAGLGLGLLITPAALVESPGLAMALLCGAAASGIACGHMLALPRIRAPHDQVALWTGVQNCAGNIGGILAPLVTGIAVARTGSYLPAFLTVSAVLIVGIASYTLVVPELMTTSSSAAAPLPR